MCAAYNVVSFAVVFSILWSLQLIVDALDMPLTRADVMDDATWAVRGLALLSLSYGWLFFGQRLFNKHAFEKSAALLLLVLACGWVAVLGTPPPLEVGVPAQAAKRAARPHSMQTEYASRPSGPRPAAGRCERMDDRPVRTGTTHAARAQRPGRRTGPANVPRRRG